MEKKYIPNYLTLARIVLTPFIVVFSLLQLYIPGLLIFSIAAITDLLDGKLSRKWHVQSKEGALLDTIADKELAICTILAFLPTFPCLGYTIGLEALIAGVNSAAFFKHFQVKSSQLGRLKTLVLFGFVATIILSSIIPSLHAILPMLGMVTTTFQVGAIAEYYYNYQKQNQLLTKKQKQRNIWDTNRQLQTLQQDFALEQQNRLAKPKVQKNPYHFTKACNIKQPWILQKENEYLYQKNTSLKALVQYYQQLEKVAEKPKILYKKK